MANTKYLLSTGVVTEDINKYIVDLFRLNLQILPDEIPGSDIGFDFILAGIQKDSILDEIKTRIKGLADRIEKEIDNPSYFIEVQSVNPISETVVQVTINVNNYIETINISSNSDNTLKID
jgi:hypothetical protein